MDRLTLPKRQPATEGESSLNTMLLNAPPGLPPDPLPTWAALSYDSKLPMILGPKGAVNLFTTDLGERVSIYKPATDNMVKEVWLVLSIWKVVSKGIAT